MSLLDWLAHFITIYALIASASLLLLTLALVIIVDRAAANSINIEPNDAHTEDQRNRNEDGL